MFLKSEKSGFLGGFWGFGEVSGRIWRTTVQRKVSGSGFGLGSSSRISASRGGGEGGVPEVLGRKKGEKNYFFVFLGVFLVFGEFF